MTETVQIHCDQGVHRITLDRPDKLNALNQQMHQELRQAFENAAQTASCRAVLLTANGRAFCVGQDLEEVNPAQMEAPPQLDETIEKFYNPLLRALKKIEVPVVCAVQGAAAGAGANLAFACDLTLAASGVNFIQAFDKIGLVPDSGGSWTLPRRIGMARAKALTLLGEPINAEQAQQWGLIYRAVAAEKLGEEAEKLALRLAKGPSLGLRLTKRALEASLHNTFDEQLDLEKDFQGRAGRSVDYAEGIRAFMEKRKPNFVGE